MSDEEAAKVIRMAFSRHELILINNALNEVCNGIHFSEGEFHARLGGSRAEGKAVLKRVHEALGGDPA